MKLTSLILLIAVILITLQGDVWGDPYWTDIKSSETITCELCNETTVCYLINYRGFFSGMVLETHWSKNYYSFVNRLNKIFHETCWDSFWSFLVEMFKDKKVERLYDFFDIFISSSGETGIWRKSFLVPK